MNALNSWLGNSSHHRVCTGLMWEPVQSANHDWQLQRRFIIDFAVKMKSSKLKTLWNWLALLWCCLAIWGNSRSGCDQQSLRDLYGTTWLLRSVAIYWFMVSVSPRLSGMPLLPEPSQPWTILATQTVKEAPPLSFLRGKCFSHDAAFPTSCYPAHPVACALRQCSPISSSRAILPVSVPQSIVFLAWTHSSLSTKGNSRPCMHPRRRQLCYPVAYLLKVDWEPLHDCGEITKGIFFPCGWT